MVVLTLSIFSYLFRRREPLLLAVSSEDSEPLSSSVHDGENQAAEEDGQEEENPNDEVPLISSP